MIFITTSKTIKLCHYHPFFGVNARLLEGDVTRDRIILFTWDYCNFPEVQHSLLLEVIWILVFPWVNLNLVLLVYVFLCVCVYWLGLDFSVYKLKTDLKNLHFLLKGKFSLVTNTTEGGEDDYFPCSGVRPYCLHNLNIGLQELTDLKSLHQGAYLLHGGLCKGRKGHKGEKIWWVAHLAGTSNLARHKQTTNPWPSGSTSGAWALLSSSLSLL